MQIGVIREIKDKENRVALTPKGIRKLPLAWKYSRIATCYRTCCDIIDE